MISDDAPDPRNGKIIQCRLLAWTLSVLWAGSLAGPWREAPCHYAAGLHHPHQFPIFSAPLPCLTEISYLGFFALLYLSSHPFFLAPLLYIRTVSPRTSTEKRKGAGRVIDDGCRFLYFSIRSLESSV